MKSHVGYSNCRRKSSIWRRSSRTSSRSAATSTSSVAIRSAAGTGHGGTGCDGFRPRRPAVHPKAGAPSAAPWFRPRAAGEQREAESDRPSKPEDGFHLFEVGKVVHAGATIAQLAHGLRPPEHELRHERQFPAAQVELLRDAVTIFGDAIAATGHDGGEALGSQHFQRVLHGAVVKGDHRIAVRLLVASSDQGVERQRVIFRSRNVFFQQRAEHTHFHRMEDKVHATILPFSRQETKVGIAEARRYNNPKQLYGNRCRVSGVRNTRYSHFPARIPSGSTLAELVGIYNLKCKRCNTEFRGALVAPVPHLVVPAVPRCYRTQLTTWDEKHYNPSTWTILKIRLGAKRYRCNICRCNFVPVSGHGARSRKRFGRRQRADRRPAV